MMLFLFDHIEFAHPWLLLSLLIVPGMIFWHIKKSNDLHAYLPVTTTMFLSKRKSLKTSLYPALFIFRCIGIASLIFALAKPQEKTERKEYEGEGIDIFLCFDVSGSMVSTSSQKEAFKPNRLGASKKIAKEFVRNRAGDNMGIVLFSSEALSLCPLTTDTAAVITQIEDINPYFLNEGGTAIGSGIAACINRLKQSKTKSKIILLMTDGVNTGGMITPDTAIALARFYNIKIYTIGIGYANTLEPITNNTKTLPDEKDGFDEVLLRKMADETKGKYFNALDETGLKSVYNSINMLEKSKIKTIIYHDKENKYALLLYIGFFLVLTELLLRYSFFRKFP